MLDNSHFKMQDTYDAAIRAVHDCIANDDRSTWRPNVVRVEEGRRIHDIDGVEAGSYGGCPSHAQALLRLLVDPLRPCSLYAYPAVVGEAVTPVDVLVGFLDRANTLTLACGDSVFPMICHHVAARRTVPAVPSNAKWIVAASLSTELRRAVALYVPRCISY